MVCADEVAVMRRSEDAGVSGQATATKLRNHIITPTDTWNDKFHRAHGVRTIFIDFDEIYPHPPKPLP